MLPSGPRSTYSLPSSVQPGSRDLARQILASIKAANAKASEVRTGMMTTGCDGAPVINPLDGTSCNGDGGTVVLFNPQTRKVLATLGKPAAGLVKTVAVAPAPCIAVHANLKTRRRFTDNLGNVYGPTGAWLSGGDPPARLESEYRHSFLVNRYLGNDEDFARYRGAELYLDKLSGAATSLHLTDSAQGMVWPSINDILSDHLNTTATWYVGTGLDDATFGGSGFSESRLWWVKIDSIGIPDTFLYWSIRVLDSDDSEFGYPAGTWLDHREYGPTHIPITGLDQPLSHGATIRFLSPTGHGPGTGSEWIGDTDPLRNVMRDGVAVRGTAETASPCIAVNRNLLVTAEMNCTFAVWPGYGGPMPDDPVGAGSHALVVRDADTLELLYRKALAYDTDALVWGDPPQKFSFSTNDEGLFFMHCYTTPVLTSPPSPYPGAEFGSPNPRKVAVISVNPLTFEPTIDELITLDDRAGSSFVVASTL